jgi:hypothetical protein
MISLPANYRDVQQELITEINRIPVWPVVVTVDGNISKPNKTDFVDRDGNYIILTTDGNIENVKTQINGLVQDGTKSTRLWNSEVRFVVAGANELSMQQQIDIFDYLLKFRIYNCIMHYVKDNKYSRPININDVDTDVKLAVYSWFPYHSSEHCSDVNHITQLDSWFISAQGHFTKNSDLFPGKISKSFNGCPMKAVVGDGHWLFTTRYPYPNDIQKVVGMKMDLLMIVLEQINMTFVHVPTPEWFEIERGMANNLTKAMFAKELYSLRCCGNLFSARLVFRLHKYPIHDECPLVCTVS